VALPDWRLLVVGDGPCRDQLEEQVHSLPNRDQVHFTGAVSHDRIPGYLAAMDITVAPYRPIDDFYFSPLKLFEYFAMGKAVIATDVGQISQMIRHGENGLLTEPANANSLAEALTLLAKDSDLRRSIADRSHHGVVTWSDIARRTTEIVRQLHPPGPST
jgi:glycosyltransferase involved in cell wall biosynthesis